MPTGYTKDIEKGISLKEFTMGCALAFFYDLDKIPDKFEVPTYHGDRLWEAVFRLEWFKTLSEEQVEEEARKAYVEKLQRFEEHLSKARNWRQKCQEMLSKIRLWQIPTEEHTRLRDFMIEQLELTLGGDGNVESWHKYGGVERLSGNEWLQKEISEAQESVSSHMEEHNKKVAWTKESNAWVKALKESLEDE